ncbi:MAG: double-strand break repair protein AddB [Pseudomonadota bacterium]
MAEPLFSPQDRPRLFAVPPGVDFGHALLAGLDARLNRARADPFARARVEIIVNTQRARRRLMALLTAAPVALSPRVRVLEDLAEDFPDLPPPLPPLSRRLELTRLVAALIAADPQIAPGAAAFALADSLARLLEEMQIEAVDTGALARLTPPESAGHWQRSLAFLKLIEPAMAAADPSGLDRAARTRLALERHAARWRAQPPAHPVIVAGSTGSRGAVAAFMAAVAGLPQGAVVLPGLDMDIPDAVWARLTAPDASQDHPQFPLAKLCDRLGLAPGDIPAWTTAAAPAAPDRNRLWSLALRPAPVTDQWLAQAPALAPTVAQACAGLSLMEAETPQEEATAIALALRRAVEHDRRAALITPDRTLARRVAAALDRWSILPDDSAGRPLGLTPPGVFLRLTAALLAGPPDPVSLVALLKHPLTARGNDDRRARHLALTAQLEQRLLRGHGPEVTADHLRAWAAEAKDPEALAWIDAVIGALPLAQPGPQPLPDRVAAHLTCAESLAGAESLWAEAAGQAAAQIMGDLRAHGGAAAPMAAAEYRALLDTAFAGVDVPEPAYLPRADIAIWGTLEARTQSADLLILGGLNEGVWPAQPDQDPWLNRQMRRDLGLPLQERRVGLSAHDFQQAACAETVILSRALRNGDAPAVPARWLLRLVSLLPGIGDAGRDALAAMRARGDEILTLHRSERAAIRPTPPASRPAPVPPPADFPTALPVTQIERLIRDPYAVYARYHLRLRPLDPLRAAPDSMARGTGFHKVLQRFIAQTRAGLPADAPEVFAKLTEAVLAAEVPWPAIRALWQARLLAFAGPFLAAEGARRARARPALQETAGRVDLGGLPRDFALTARADRIDSDGAGGVAIYDYKGTLPSAKQAAAFHKQLPLEAGIALRGGFEDLRADRTLALELLGTDATAKTLALEADHAALDQVWDELSAMLTAYMCGAGMVARARPALQSYGGDYDHLARHGEWADSDPWVTEPVP